MKLTLKNWYLTLAIGLILCSCATEVKQEVAVEPLPTIIPPSQVRLDQICRSYANNDFRGLIGMMHNYKDKPAAYQKQLINMLKQRANDRLRDSLQIKQIRPSQVITRAEEKIADVYLDISYSSGAAEEIILPMIYDNGNWWIK